MTTNSDVAFNNWFYDRFKDTDVSAYSSHEFIKAKSNMRYGYIAAKAESEKEIAELKENYTACSLDYAEKVYEILHLKASNNRLRELLSEARDDVYEVLANYEQNLPYKQYRYDAQKQLAHGITEALSTTPSQSLAEHDNEVIERIAYAFNDEPDAVRIMYKIRTLKGK